MKAEQYFNNGFGADVEKVHRKHVIELMTNFAKHYHKEQLRLHNVSQQRELLNSFAEAWNVSMIKKEYILDSDIDRFIKIKTI